MSTPSIAHQVMRCINAKTLSELEQVEMKAELGVESLKKALRPGGDPTKLLDKIIGHESASTYFETGRTFFRRGKELTGEKLLSMMLKQETILAIFDTYYAGAAPGTIGKIQPAIKHIFAGACLLGWASGPCPIENELRETIVDHDRQPRDGYHPEDAIRIIEELYRKGSRFALPTEIALVCGLREDEIAGLRGEYFDRAGCCVSIRGKGGRRRVVPVPSWLLEKIPSVKGYLFTPSQSWKASFRRAVWQVCNSLELGRSGVHRLRSTFAQLTYTESRLQGSDESTARKYLSPLLGHNRIDVTRNYVPAGFPYEDFTQFVEKKHNGQ